MENVVLTDLVNFVVVPIIVALAGVITRAIVRYVNANATLAQRQLIEDIARSAVLFVEGTATGRASREKLAMAVTAAETELRARGVPVELGTLVVAVEAQVKQNINWAKKPAPAPADTEAQPA